MPARTLIIFDLDDTLVDTSDVYWRARSAFVEFVAATTGADPQAVIDQFERIDAQSIQVSGYGPERYHQTMLAAYVLFSKNTPPSALEAIRSFASIIQTKLPKALPGSQELLEWTSQRFRLALLTRGERSLQLRKLDDSGFVHFFESIEVVKSKSASTFRATIENFKCNPEETWVIGDSISADINPGLKAGAKCIRYIYRHSHYHWDQDSGVSPAGSFMEVTALTEIIPILQSGGASTSSEARFDRLNP